jgi:hypothetical protein
MSSSPSTFKGEPVHHGIDWDDPSSLHRSDDGGGLLNGLKGIRQGGLAELIRFVLTLPEADRPRYVIDKSGDHRLTIGEIMALSRRADFPEG